MITEKWPVTIFPFYVDRVNIPPEGRRKNGCLLSCDIGFWYDIAFQPTNRARELDGDSNIDINCGCPKGARNWYLTYGNHTYPRARIWKCYITKKETGARSAPKKKATSQEGKWSRFEIWPFWISSYRYFIIAISDVAKWCDVAFHTYIPARTRSGYRNLGINCGHPKGIPVTSCISILSIVCNIFSYVTLHQW